MSTMLIFSDLHASKQAINNIVPLIEQVDLSIFCGDILGYGKDIDYCIDFVLNNVDLAVIGNHDILAITDETLEGQHPAVKESILFTRSKLSTAQIEAISSLPKEIWYNDIYITHTIEGRYLRYNNDLANLYEKIRKDTKYVFFGHTHEQVLCRHNNTIIINPGSITKGRNGFHRSYVIIHDESENIEFVNLEPIL